MTEAAQTGKKSKLKCRFCHIKVMRWKKMGGGKVIDGFDTLKDHIMIYHPEEADKMGMKW